MGPHVFNSGGKIYSVDMMITYINIFKPKSKCVNIDIFYPLLEDKVWKDRMKNKRYTPLEVISDPRKYSKQIARIEKADLNYPIIVEKTNNKEYPIIDGVHRIVKAYLSGKTKIEVYEFNQTLMKKFIIGKNSNWKAIDNMAQYDFMELFHRRFCR